MACTRVLNCSNAPPPAAARNVANITFNKSQVYFIEDNITYTCKEGFTFGYPSSKSVTQNSTCVGLSNGTTYWSKVSLFNLTVLKHWCMLVCVLLIRT